MIKCDEEEVMKIFGYIVPGEKIYRSKIGFIGVINGITGYSGGFAGNVTNECLIVKNYRKYKNGKALGAPEAKKDILKRWTGNSVPKNIDKTIEKLIQKEVRK